MVALIAIYVIITVYQNHEEIENPENTQQEGVSGDSFSDIVYTLESGDNTVSLVATSSGERSTTDYKFENDKLSEIVITEEIFSGDLVNEIYEGIVSNANLNQTYSSIEVQENSIIMKLKDEYVATFGERSMAEIFDEINGSLRNNE